MLLPIVHEAATCITACSIVGLLMLGMAGCANQSSPGTKSGAGTNRDLLDALADHTDTVVLGADNGPQIIITPGLSARILGAAIDGADDENMMWVDATVMDGSIWTTEPRFWNAGGLRSWLAPEDLFFVNPEKDPESWFVPTQLDPVQYGIVEQNADSAVLEADMDIPANIGETYHVTLRRSIALETVPPEEAGAIPAGVSYMGIEKTHTLTNRGDAVIGEDLPAVCLWSLLQINPSGTTLVPLAEGADPETAYREYFNPLGDRLAVQNGIISVKIDGAYRLKIGVRPEAAGDGVAFLRDDGDGTGVLIAKVFDVDPEGVYVDKPWGKDSDYGDAVELYNDDGAMGGFAEIEAHGPSLKLANGDSQSHTLTLHIFRGSLDDLKSIASGLYGVDFTAAKYF
jgi:hypothetical protein